MENRSVKEQLMELCENTYNRELPFLQREYPGLYVAISSTGIIDYGEIPSHIKKRCGDKGLDYLLFYVPIPEDNEDKPTLNIPWQMPFSLINPDE